MNHSLLVSLLSPAAPHPFANANGAHFSLHSIGGGCKTPPLPLSTLTHRSPCGASPCGAPWPALRGPSGAPRGPARAAQGAVEAGAGPLASSASPSLASLALGALQAVWLVCGAVLEGGCQYDGKPVRASERGARRALGERLGRNDVSSAPANRQGLRLCVQAHPGGVCDGGRGERGPHGPISFTDSC